MSLLIAFASFRTRSDAGNIFFYKHDGVSKGELLEPLPTESPRRRSDYRPSLCADGRLCAFAIQYREVVPGELRLWDMRAKKLLTLPDRNKSGSDAQPAMSGDGRWMAFCGWQRPGGLGAHDLFLYDLKENRLVDLPNLNTEYDEQAPALSQDGRWLAYITNRPLSGAGFPGMARICLYDRSTGQDVPLPGMAMPPFRDCEPSLSGDGRYLAFTSHRPDPDGSEGPGSIYLYDRSAAAFVALPGLNSASHDCQPSLSPGGRFLAFTSERFDGMGQRDLYLYDIKTRKLLPTPGLNHASEEFEASIAVLDPAMDRL